MQAIEIQTNLVTAHTLHIREAEAQTTQDAVRISFHYKARLAAIVRALELGANPAYLSEITGLGYGL